MRHQEIRFNMPSLRELEQKFGRCGGVAMVRCKKCHHEIKNGALKECPWCHEPTGFDPMRTIPPPGGTGVQQPGQHTDMDSKMLPWIKLSESTYYGCQMTTWAMDVPGPGVVLRTMTRHMAPGEHKWSVSEALVFIPQASTHRLLDDIKKLEQARGDQDG